MTILEKLEMRKNKADQSLEAFRNKPECIKEYCLVCKHITIWSCLKAFCNAPLTMNPNKIKQHLDSVVGFLLEYTPDESERRILQTAADEFTDALTNGGLLTVKSYEQQLRPWIFRNVPMSIQDEAHRLTDNYYNSAANN